MTLIPLLRKAAAYRGQSARAAHRWFVASSGSVKVLFGLRPEQKWPTAGLPGRTIQGVTVWVAALPARDKSQRGRGGIHHRVGAFCPVCDKAVTLGRLGQHLAVHPEYEVPNA